MATLIKIKKISQQGYLANYEIGPLEQGFGNTLAVPIRRILVSKIKGCALTSLKIKGVEHEFSTLPGVKDDMLRVILNLQKVIFRLNGVDTAKITLDFKGIGEVKASDIDLPGGVEIINPDFVITELTTKDAHLQLEGTVESGYGFVLKDDSLRNKEIGLIPLNKSFSPILRINYDVKSTRVGQDTNYEKIVFEILTNGAVDPDDALAEAIKKALEKFNDLNQAVQNIEE